MQFRDSPLYATAEKPSAKINRAYTCIYFGAILGLIYYRIRYIPNEGYLWWILVFGAELGFAFIWILDRAFRWQPVDRYTFPQRLSERFEKELPPVDIFICTADPTKEPPITVINTVLSTLAFDYPVDKLSCYVSDDGGSPLTFYALFEASCFAKVWVPFCRKYNIQQRCPQVYFSDSTYGNKIESLSFVTEWKNVKKLYDEMKYCINSTVERGTVPEDKIKEHNGFQEWSRGINSRDHPSIFQSLLQYGEDTGFEGHDLPTLVYLSREKRPRYPHNFKAGALNALIRVSSIMSNAPFILTLDCDMYANNCQALREMLCFFMDPETGHQFGYVQIPQRFHGVTKNDLYANNLTTVDQIPLKGLDGFGGPLYIGTGCLHRRDALCGKSPKSSISWKNESKDKLRSSASKMVEDARELSQCTHEQNTQWGIEIGMLYNCAVEDVLTGYAIQCRGWKSVLCVPRRNAFVGCPNLNLNDTLIQQKRWAAGHLEMLFCKFSPLVYGNSIGHRMCYTNYGLWAPTSLHMLCYAALPALSMLGGLSLFPKISDPWLLLFAFLSLSAYAFNAIEFVSFGGGNSFKGWWNEQRMWMIKGVSSYLFGLIQVVCKLLGIAKVGFEVTSKVSDNEAAKRYEAEIFEFGVASALFIPPATLAVINLIALLSGIAGVVKEGYPALNGMFVQMMLSSFIVINSYPLYEGMLVRKDKGCMPTSITLTSIVAAAVACVGWIVS